jgi:hypothetical protein
VKPFAVKPFVVNIDHTRPDMGKPHWPISLAAWMSLLWSQICFVGAWVIPELIFPLLMLGNIGLASALGFFHVARFVRSGVTERDELTRLVAEQNVRIAKLEERVVALLADRTTEPHAA